MSTVAPFQPGYLSIEGAAKYASVSTKTIKRWIQGGLPAYAGTTRGKVLIRPSDIDLYLTRKQASCIDLTAMVEEVMKGLSLGPKTA
jgi:excisionase family DNA binding protein